MDDQQDTGAELARDHDDASRRPPDVVCWGGFTLPRISAFMPTGDRLAELLMRKAQADGE
jgi:hypothetical protein